MAYYEGHSEYSTDCLYFSWHFVNYSKGIAYDSMYSGGNRLYAPQCGKSESYSMFMRPIGKPCDDCPYYEQDTEKGRIPPGGYNV